MRLFLLCKTGALRIKQWAPVCSVHIGLIMPSVRFHPQPSLHFLWRKAYAHSM